jgi:hypothetical protein
VNLSTSCANLDPGISSRCSSPILSPSSRTFAELTLVNWRRPWRTRRLDFVIRAGSFNFFVDKISKFCGCPLQQQLDRFNKICRQHQLSSTSLRSSPLHRKESICGQLHRSSKYIGWRPGMRGVQHQLRRVSSRRRFAIKFASEPVGNSKKQCGLVFFFQIQEQAVKQRIKFQRRASYVQARNSYYYKSKFT